jgi:16S rRNA (guanine527-N7)-methyltransferase
MPSVADPRGKPLPPIAGPEDFARAFDVPRETTDRLALYADRLQNWQRAVNLVAPSTLDEVWHRHFADSAQLLALAPEAKIWLDLGSGGGFPGLVIAIMLANHENRIVHLVESNSRKCAFLADVARSTGTSVQIHQARIEDAARGGRIGRVDVVTSRALAPLARLLGLAHGFFAEETIGLFLKGRDASQEIEEARKHWQFEVETVSSRTGGDGAVVEVRTLISKGDDSR